MKLYGEISKTEELDDGTIKVWGYASSQSVDSDGEIVCAEAMKAALPDYLRFGAVREMHQPKAAGTAIEAEVQDDGRTWFGAHVVDSEAVKKVKANVYKGFSIGGKVTARDEANKSLIKGIKLVEISLVDRPANPEAVFTVYKAEALEKPVAAEDQASAVDRIAAMLNSGEIAPERLLELAKRDSVQDAMEPSASAAKSGARFSAETKAALAEIHQGMLDLCDKMDGLGYKNDQGGDEDDAGGEGDEGEDGTGAKAAGLQKSGDLTKAELLRLSDALKKADERIRLADERIRALEAQPAPGKALLKSVAKGQDLGSALSQPEVQPVRNADGSTEDIATLIKSIHASGGQRLAV
jgi:hypothetical protein